MTNFANIADLETDSSKELEGARLDFGEDRYLLVARAGGANRAFNALWAELMAPYEHLRSIGKMTEEQALDVYFESYAREIVKGWGGWKDGNGEEVPFSQEALIDLFHQSNDIFWRTKRFSESMSNYRSSMVKGAKENLENFSPGKKSLANTPNTSTLQKRRA